MSNLEQRIAQTSKFGAGVLLSQTALAATTNTALFSANTLTGVNVELTHIIVCNSTGTARSIRIFIDDDGDSSPTYSSATSLWYDYSVAANTTEILYQSKAEGCGLSLGDLAVVGAYASATGVTVSLYGVASSIGS